MDHLWAAMRTALSMSTRPPALALTLMGPAVAAAARGGRRVVGGGGAGARA